MSDSSISRRTPGKQEPEAPEKVVRVPPGTPEQPGLAMLLGVPLALALALWLVKGQPVLEVAAILLAMVAQLWLLSGPSRSHQRHARSSRTKGGTARRT